MITVIVLIGFATWIAANAAFVIWIHFATRNRPVPHDCGCDICAECYDAVTRVPVR